MLLDVYGRLRSAGRQPGSPSLKRVSFPRARQLRPGHDAAAGAVDAAARAELDDYLSSLSARLRSDLRQLPDPPETAGGRSRMRPRPCERPPSGTSRRATGYSSRSCTRPSTPRTRAKARESAVDFEDLQLLAGSARAGQRDGSAAPLPLDHGGRVPGHRRHSLQCEHVRHRCGGAPAIRGRIGSGLFFVGDEFQSIYRFRHADVDVFRERRAAGDGLLALTTNYRSRPEVLGVVNHLFGPEFGERYAPSKRAASSRAARRPCRRGARDRQGERRDADRLASRGGAPRRAPRP